VLTDYSGKSLDQKLVWRMILDCVATSSKHRNCLRLLSNVVIQRVLCRARHSKEITAYVYQLSDEIFGKVEMMGEETTTTTTGMMMMT
jgi:hypothetical protein